MSLVSAQRSLGQAETVGDLTLTGARETAERLVGAIGLSHMTPLPAG